MTEAQARTTRGIASALGPFLVIFGIAVAIRADELPLFVPAFFSDGILVFVTGAFTLALGLGILAAHRRLDTLAAVIITVFAFLTAVRGVVLLIAPGLVSTFAAAAVRTPGVVLFPAVLAVLIGAYLIFVSWFAPRNQNA